MRTLCRFVLATACAVIPVGARADVIVMTSAQADAVRSKPTPYAAIEPVPLTDGSYIVGEEVLVDPAHAAKKAALQALPKATAASIKDKLPGTTKK